MHLLPPPGFRPPPPGSKPPLPDEDDPLIRIADLKEAHVALTPAGAMVLIVFRNGLTGDIDYEYEAQLLESLSQESHYPGPKCESSE